MEKIIKSGQRSEKKVESAVYLCEYLNKLPEDKMFGVIRKKGTLSIIEEETICIKVIRNKLGKINRELNQKLRKLNKNDRTLSVTEQDRIDALYYQIDILEEILKEAQE